MLSKSDSGADDAIKIRFWSRRCLGNRSYLWHHRNGRLRNRCSSNLRNHRNGSLRNSYGTTLDRIFGGTLFLNRMNKAKTRITAALVVWIVMKTFVSHQVIRIVFVLVPNAYVDRLVMARIQHGCSEIMRSKINDLLISS